MIGMSVSPPNPSRAVLLVVRADELAQRRLHRDVEPDRRLVEKQRRRAVEQGGREVRRNGGKRLPFSVVYLFRVRCSGIARVVSCRLTWKERAYGR